MSNPYTITFGRTAKQYIPRIRQREQVIEDFNSDQASSQAYMIVGVRGSGKTVMLTEISKKIGAGWIVIDLLSRGDITHALTSQLYSEPSVQKLFVKAKIDLSFMGLGVHIEGAVPAYDDQTAITRMLKELKAQGKRVLVTIDEVADSKEMKRFAALFQILTRNDLPLYLLMAGIPENIYGLIDDRRSTFLYRTPRIEMTPLNYEMISHSHMRTLKVSKEISLQLSHLTNGYPFAYQALGYVCWGKKIDPEDTGFANILAEYDYYLQEFSYVKTWDEMSGNDKRFMRAVAAGKHAAADIQKETGMDSKTYSVYRIRLKRKGILGASSYGEVRLLLPRFEEFIAGLPE